MSYSLADELRMRAESEIALLFTLRPDLISPVPPDFSALAARANSMPSVMRARDALNKWEIDILTAICTLGDPISLMEVLSMTSKDAKSAVLSLWQRALIYKDGEHYRVPSNVRVAIGEHPAGLGPAATTKIDFSLLEDAPSGATDLLQRMVWGPPKGQVADVKKAPPAIKWLITNNFLIPFDSQTVLLPREVALHFRDGKVFKELQATQPIITGTSRKQKDVNLAAIANIGTFIRWCEELAHNWSDEPPMGLKSGGLGVRDLKRTSEHLGISESCAAFVAELLFIAGLIVIDTDDQIMPTNAFDIWLTRSIEERWHAIASLWLETSRMSGLIGKAENKNISALGPELDRAGVSLIKRNALEL